MFMCARRGACMLRAGVEVVSEVVYREAFPGAFVMVELGGCGMVNPRYWQW